MAEHRTVDAGVVGSTPISHPGYQTSEYMFRKSFSLIDFLSDVGNDLGWPGKY